MRADLAETQWETLAQGEPVGPDGVKYVRRSTRAKRRVCDDLLHAGSALVLYYWAGGQLEWTDGEDALNTWATTRSAVVPEARSRGDLEWTAGVWQAEDGQTLVLLTGHC